MELYLHFPMRLHNMVRENFKLYS